MEKQQVEARSSAPTCYYEAFRPIGVRMHFAKHTPYAHTEYANEQICQAQRS